MIDRICISINNRCNLTCKYCHFHEKGIINDIPMDVIDIINNVKKYAKHTFKIGFVGNGEPFLDIMKLKNYISIIEDTPNIKAYTITNGTLDLSDDDWMFLENHSVNVGFSLDGYKELHNMNRCDSYDTVLHSIEHYEAVTGHYPTFNATVGKESIMNKDRIITFFEQFGTRVTFSRMIGKYGIELDEYRDFLEYAEKRLNVRRGERDCTMYGGQCGAGVNNYFFANGYVYYCGNCIDLKPIAESSISLFELEKMNLQFDRSNCYKEYICE